MEDVGAGMKINLGVEDLEGEAIHRERRGCGNLI